ncbi:LOW QUALITY PROTEIN: hypothetical protein NC653_030914 [Populus alba x Populus x berolinensis]|uniref:DUF2470 domain-containing protein n=1 Tax=Populus alba x Populus x berolinensis TaxID=444605 RepID=A0AAD6LXI7_9ROSI|nr:LOW QUALITY PROTEIN: hypothetical protein NC653_030914 [Populus alba x Populus x berolinensis]
MNAAIWNSVRLDLVKLNSISLLAKNSLNLGFIMNWGEGSLTVSRSGYRLFQVQCFGPSEILEKTAAAINHKKHEGYPSGSMVDFACDADGSPIVAVSSWAVHAKDLIANPKCSLLVAKDPEDRTDLVITLHGDSIPVSEKDVTAVRTTYLAKHPDAFRVDFGDFQFMRIEPKVVQYMSGAATTLLGSGEFSKEEYQTAKVDPIAQFSKPVASHMNRDHAEDTRLIVQHSTSIPVDSAYMLDVDSLGFNVKAVYQGNTYKLRIPFPRRAEERKDVKTLVVEMLQAAKS